MEDLELKVGVEGQQQFMAAVNAMAAAVDKMSHAVDRLGKESDETDKKTKKVAKSTMGFGDVLSALGVGFSIQAVVQGVTSLAKGAFEAASGYESLSIQMGVLLGDAKKVEPVLASLKKFSDATPFEPTQVNAAARSLLAFGFDAEKIIPTLTKIGDVSAGTGKDFNELVTIYGKARVAGTLYAEDINQLTEAGVPIMEEFAKVMGVQVDQVKKMGSEGKISFSVFEKAFGNLVTEGGKFGGMMEKLSLSTEGIMSTLKGEIEGVLRELGTAFLPMIKELATAAIPLLKSALAQIQPFLKELPNYLSRAFEAGKSVVAPLISIYDSMSKLYAILEPFLPDLLGVNVGFEEGEKNAGMLAKALNVVADVLEWVSDAVTYVKDAWDRFIANSPKIRAMLDGISQALEYMTNPLKAVGDLWNWAFGDGSESVTGLSEKSMAVIKQLTDEAVKGFGATTDQVKDFSKSLQASEFAGMSQGEALTYLQTKFAAYMKALDETAKKTKGLGEDTEGTGKGIKDVAGSIAEAEAQLKKLNEQFTNAGSDLKRSGLVPEIERLEAVLYKMKNLTKMEETIKFKVDAPVIGMAAPSDEDVEALLGIPKEQGRAYMDAQKHLSDYVEATNQGMSQMAGAVELPLSAWDRFKNVVGEDGMESLKKGLEEIKQAFIGVGIAAVEGLGYAIGAGESIGEVFANAIRQLMVEVPKLAGMALLNTAAGMTGNPAALPLAAAGLALIGLSGLFKGIQDKNAKEREAAMADLPTSANAPTGGGSGVGGLGGYVTDAQDTPIVVNVTAEMDGIALGGLIRRVSTEYGKTAIKQR